MSPQEPKGPFCQSCSMPLGKPEDFGTDQAGYRVNDFCRHCFANGEFTEPEISMTAMLDRCVAIMNQQGIMPAAQARALLAEVLPRLKRWRTPAGSAR
jgi:putative zinc ribbon protein